MGFILMLFGISSAAVSSVYGRVVKYIPECFVLLFGAIIQGGLVIFLLVWRREPSYATVIIFVIGWGAGDAVWQITYSGKRLIHVIMYVLVCICACVCMCAGYIIYGIVSENGTTILFFPCFNFLFFY